MKTGCTKSTEDDGNLSEATKCPPKQFRRRLPEGPSYWFNDPKVIVPAGQARLPGTVDVAIVGGGIMGVATTYFLTRLGIGVALFEASRPGWGASGRNAGLMLSGSSPLEDPELIRGVLRDEHIDAEFLEVGHLALASSDRIVEKIQQEVTGRPASAPPLRWFSRCECEDLLGLRISDSFLGGRWLPSGRSIHPLRFLYGLAAAASSKGAILAYDAEVLRIWRAGVFYEVVTTRGQVRARQVVLACNVHATKLLSGLCCVLTAIRGQVVCTSPLPLLFRHGMAVDWGTLYWRQARDGAIVLGGYHNLDPHTETTSQEGLNSKIQAALSKFLPESFPGFPAFSLKQRWSGIMDQTADGKPMVGQWLDGSPFWILAGFSGHGLPPALGVGKAIAEAIVRGTKASELDALDPLRFKDRFLSRVTSLPRRTSIDSGVKEAQ